VQDKNFGNRVLGKTDMSESTKDIVLQARIRQAIINLVLIGVQTYAASFRRRPIPTLPLHK
jgi:hypothetical protein